MFCVYANVNYLVLICSVGFLEKWWVVHWIKYNEGGSINQWDYKYSIIFTFVLLTIFTLLNVSQNMKCSHWKNCGHTSHSWTPNHEAIVMMVCVCFSITHQVQMLSHTNDVSVRSLALRSIASQNMTLFIGKESILHLIPLLTKLMPTSKHELFK
jgi:Na+/H+-translocating membrane pyrophosphatase